MGTLLAAAWDGDGLHLVAGLDLLGSSGGRGLAAGIMSMSYQVGPIAAIGAGIIVLAEDVNWASSKRPSRPPRAEQRFRLAVNETSGPFLSPERDGINPPEHNGRVEEWSPPGSRLTSAQCASAITAEQALTPPSSWVAVPGATKRWPSDSPQPGRAEVLRHYRSTARRRR